MFNKKLCQNCKTGADAYLIDGQEPMCPYIYSHNGKKCNFYKPLSKPRKVGILNKLIKGNHNSIK